MTDIERATPGTAPSLQPRKRAKRHARAPAPEVVIESERPAGFVRKPFGQRGARLSITPRPGFHRHWFNDNPGRIDQAREAGYTHVKDERGKVLVRTVDRGADGKGLKAYCMEIPQEWHDADLKLGQKPADETEAAILSGNIARKEGDNRYVPKDGIKIEAD